MITLCLVLGQRSALVAFRTPTVARLPPGNNFLVLRARPGEPSRSVAAAVCGQRGVPAGALAFFNDEDPPMFAKHWLKALRSRLLARRRAGSGRGARWSRLWLERLEDRCVPAGGFTEVADGITPGSEALEITAGPAGNLWFTEKFAN